MIKVALDAMGGDYAPSVCLEGAVNAVKKNPDIHVVLCGPEAEVKAGLEKLGYTGNGISVVDEFHQRRKKQGQCQLGNNQPKGRPHDDVQVWCHLLVPLISTK